MLTTPLPNLALPQPQDFDIDERANSLVLALMTGRSYSQHNTVVYKIDDQYRGMPHRHCILMNRLDAQKIGLAQQYLVTVQGDADKLENVERWMAHINLLYGFLSESYFAEAVEIIAPALAQLQPFQITLADFQTFTHRKSSTAWLRPVVQPENALHELQTVLQNLFPQYDEQLVTMSNEMMHTCVGGI